MGNVIPVRFGAKKERAESRAFLSGKIRELLKPAFPDRVGNAEAIADQILGALDEVDLRMRFQFQIPRPVADDGSFSEEIFQAGCRSIDSRFAEMHVRFRDIAREAIFQSGYGAIVHLTMPSKPTPSPPGAGIP